jgi:hypothetical protein
MDTFFPILMMSYLAPFAKFRGEAEVEKVEEVADPLLRMVA